jgi:hypothetical protein
MFRDKCTEVNKELLKAKKEYFSDKVENCGRDQKAVFLVLHIAGSLLEPKSSGLPTHTSASSLADEFSAFFDGKIINIRDSLTQPANVGVSNSITTSSPQELSRFHSLDQDSVAKLVQSSASKSCELDPLPTWLLKHCLPELLPLMTAVVSLHCSMVPTTL